jgi:ferritin-like metal-binding protein YciE
MKTLQTLFLDELADIYDAEQRIARALPKMVKAATCTRLQAAHDEAAQLLKENLDQEKGADEALTDLARSGNNEEAFHEESVTDSGKNLKISRRTSGRSPASRFQHAGDTGR